MHHGHSAWKTHVYQGNREDSIKHVVGFCFSFSVCIRVKNTGCCVFLVDWDYFYYWKPLKPFNYYFLYSLHDWKILWASSAILQERLQEKHKCQDARTISCIWIKFNLPTSVSLGLILKQSWDFTSLVTAIWDGICYIWCLPSPRTINL